MNKKTVSWAASVMMAGSLAAAPFAGAQTMGGSQQGMMMGSGMGQQMGGPMGPMMGGEPDMFSPEALGFDIEEVFMKAASKNALPPLCQPQAAEIKAGDEDALMDCEDALEEAAIDLVSGNAKMTGQQISDALGIGKALKAGGVSQAKRVRAVAQVKVMALEAQDATDMAQSMEQEREANIAQRQEIRKQESSMRQNMVGQMGMQQGLPAGQAGTMPGGSMMQPSMGGQVMPGMQGGMMPPMTGGSMGMQPPMSGQMQGGMMPPMNGMGGNSGMPMPPMMNGGMPPPQGGQMMPPPQGGAPSGQPMPPPGGTPPPPPPTASAINALGVGFWKGFFNFLGF